MNYWKLLSRAKIENIGMNIFDIESYFGLLRCKCWWRWRILVQISDQGSVCIIRFTCRTFNILEVLLMSTIVGMRFYSLLSFPFFTGGAFLFLLFEELCLEICLTSSISLSDSVSTNCLDLLRFPFMMGLAVADFLGTTLGCCCLDTPGFLEEAAPPFFLEAAASCSESSSLIGRGLAFAFVTNPDFLFVTGVGFFLFFSDVGSFLLGLLVGLLCNNAENIKNLLL